VTFIQVFNRYLLPGGEENSVARIADHLERGGHQVTHFWRASAEWPEAGVRAKFKQLFLMFNNRGVLNELRALHTQTKPHAWILHNVIPVVSLGVYRLARELRVPIIQWLHNYRPLSLGGALRAANQELQPDDPWLAAKEILAGTWRNSFLTGWLWLGYAMARRRNDFSAVQAWIAVSQAMKDIFVRGGWPADRLHVLHHSWDITKNKPGESDSGHFLFLGRMIETKGVRFLVDLWREPALQSIPLVMAGQGPLADELRNFSPPNIRWVGLVEGEQKKALLGACRAVVFPALWAEPLSTVAYEAYDMGKPILSSNVGGMKEIILDQQTGHLLPPASPKPWQDAILRCAHDPAYARRLGLNGRQWLEKNVSPMFWNQRFDAILDRAKLS
jgi:glycosyltransferase involved in cell wall biosynthesis